MKKILTLLAIALVGLASCKPEEEVQYSISVEPTELTFTSAGGEKTVKVTSSGSWELYGECYWCAPSLTYGEGNAEIVFTVQPNTDAENSRSCTFEFVSSDKYVYLSVAQDKKEYFIDIDSTELTFDADGGEKKIVVASSDEWDVRGKSSWCEVSQYFGNSGDTVTFSVMQNIDVEKSRISIFTFVCGDKEVELFIEQKANTEENLAYTVEVKDKGTLASILEEQDITDAEYLIIKGELNDLDFLTIRNMPALKYLDISAVNIAILPENAFYETTIETIFLPVSLTEIGYSAFEDGKVKCVVLGENVESIGSDAFVGSDLESMKIPASVEDLGSYCFARCENLKSVEFEEGCKISDFPYGAFRYSGLTSVIIPASVETIGAIAFSECEELAAVEFEKNSKLLKIEEGAFSSCNKLESVYIPAGVTVIESYAFEDCYSLKSVVFEEGTQIQKIEGGLHKWYDGVSGTMRTDYTGAFRNTNIQLFSLDAKVPPAIEGAYTFYDGIADMAVLLVPEESVDAYKSSNWGEVFSNISVLSK